MKRKIIGWVDKSGKHPVLQPENKSNFSFLMESKSHGQRVWITVEDYHFQSTPSQHSLYHFVVQEIADETGMSYWDTRGRLEKMFLTRVLLTEGGEVVVQDGKLVTYIQVVDQLNKKEFTVFLEQIRVLCAEFFNFVPEHLEQIV